MSGLPKNSHLTRYNSKNFFYIRKPHDIPSVRGSRFSIFELLEEYIQTHEDDLTALIFQNQNAFGLDSERGLCNRLDVPTSGLLYFAKNTNIYNHYRQLQSSNQLIKYYTATLTGHIKTEQILGWGIAHHPHLSDRMITAHNTKNASQQHNRHYGWTHIQPLFYDKQYNRTDVCITIMGGIRHQIRIHCASAGSPIVGETLYGTKKNRQPSRHLQLFCVGHSSLET